MTSDELELESDQSRCYCGKKSLSDSQFCQTCEDEIKAIRQYFESENENVE